MDDLSRIIERLRVVRKAQHKFLQLWAVEQAVIAPGLDRVAADIESAAVGTDFWNAPATDGQQPGFSLGE
jgi:hypothetical protein